MRTYRVQQNYVPMFALLNRTKKTQSVQFAKNVGASHNILNCLKIKIMNALRNKVQLIGRLGQDPEIITFNDGNKMAKFSLATDDSYKDKKGQKVERAYWHNIIVKGGLVNVVENYVNKGQEIALEGKLTNRSWDDKDGTKRYVTEILCNELLMLSK